MKTKREQILDISKNLKLSHIGSCLSVLPILEEIYNKKKPEDKVILDNGHAHLAHLLYTKPGQEADLIKQYGIHCDRKAGCDSSGGSLGHGLGIGIGMALAHPDIKVYVVVSDGSMMEGSNWEALRIRNGLNLWNLEIHCNFNGFSAVAEVNRVLLMHRMSAFASYLYPHFTKNGSGFEGVAGHYLTLE